MPKGGNFFFYFKHLLHQQLKAKFPNSTFCHAESLYTIRKSKNLNLVVIWGFGVFDPRHKNEDLGVFETLLHTQISN